MNFAATKLALHGPTLAVLLVLLILLIGFPLLAARIAARLRHGGPSVAKHVRFIRIIVVEWTVTALAIYALALHGQRPADVGLRPPHVPLDYLIGLAVLAAQLASSMFMPRRISADYAQRVSIVIPNNSAQWLWFLPVAASAAFCEEFLYRGYALTALAALSGFLVVGVVLSALAFGLAHFYQGPRGMFMTATIGLVYSVIVLWTGSLWPAILAHFVQDFGGAALLAQRLKSAPT